MEYTYESVKKRLAAGEKLRIEGSGRRLLYSFQNDDPWTVSADIVRRLVCDGVARKTEDAVIADTPERARAERVAAENARGERRRNLREARLARWAGWMAAARTTAEQKKVAERIALQAMILGGLDDDAVILEGDPPKGE
jgi:hypothetical protein